MVANVGFLLLSYMKDRGVRTGAFEDVKRCTIDTKQFCRRQSLSSSLRGIREERRMPNFAYTHIHTKQIKNKLNPINQ